MKDRKIYLLLGVLIATFSIFSVVCSTTESSDADVMTTLQGWLAEKEGSIASKEALLSTVMRALEDDLPVTMLIDKIKEGLGPTGVPQPKVPLSEISQEVARRAQLLYEVRALL